MAAHSSFIGSTNADLWKVNWINAFKRNMVASDAESTNQFSLHQQKRTPLLGKCTNCTSHTVYNIRAYNILQNKDFLNFSNWAVHRVHSKVCYVAVDLWLLFGLTFLLTLANFPHFNGHPKLLHHFVFVSFLCAFFINRPKCMRQ